jgi:hypothetical protein
MEEEARGAKLHHRDPKMPKLRNGKTGTRFFMLNPTVQVKLKDRRDTFVLLSVTTKTNDDLCQRTRRGLSVIAKEDEESQGIF